MTVDPKIQLQSMRLGEDNSLWVGLRLFFERDDSSIDFATLDVPMNPLCSVKGQVRLTDIYIARKFGDLFPKIPDGIKSQIESFAAQYWNDAVRAKFKEDFGNEMKVNFLAGEFDRV